VKCAVTPPHPALRADLSPQARLCEKSVAEGMMMFGGSI
jgi:hypothetical protein